MHLTVPTVDVVERNATEAERRIEHCNVQRWLVNNFEPSVVFHVYVWLSVPVWQRLVFFIQFTASFKERPRSKDNFPSQKSPKREEEGYHDTGKVMAIALSVIS